MSADKKYAKFQTRDFSFVDALYVVTQRARAIEVVRKEAYRRADVCARKMTVADAGCYDGRLYWYLEQSRLYPQYVGIDVRDDFLEEAIRNTPRGRTLFTKIDLSAEYPGDTLAIPEMPYSQSLLADVVVCLEVLEHVPEKSTLKVLRNLFMLTAPGGLVVLGCPMNSSSRVFHDEGRETSKGHASFPIYEKVRDAARAWGYEEVEASWGASQMSTYRLPSNLGEPWITMRDRLGATVRRIVYLACSDEPNGGGWFVWRKVKHGKET